MKAKFNLDVLICLKIVFEHCVKFAVTAPKIDSIDFDTGTGRAEVCWNCHV